MNIIPAIVGSVRDDLRELRAHRAERRRVAEELAAYTTPAEIDDLLATLDRYDTAEAAHYRGILSARRAAFHARMAS